MQYHKLFVDNFQKQQSWHKISLVRFLLQRTLILRKGDTSQEIQEMGKVVLKPSKKVLK